MTATQGTRNYTDGEIHDVAITPVTIHEDGRGWLAEIFREDELSDALRPQMAYISATRPGITRGPHEHRDQADYFVFLGPGDFQLVLWDARPGSPTQGRRQVLVTGASNPQKVVVPAGVVHAYRNLSDQPGWVINAPNRLYAGRDRAAAVDEIRHEDGPASPFQLPPARKQSDDG